MGGSLFKFLSACRYISISANRACSIDPTGHRLLYHADLFQPRASACTCTCASTLYLSYPTAHITQLSTSAISLQPLVQLKTFFLNRSCSPEIKSSPQTNPCTALSNRLHLGAQRLQIVQSHSRTEPYPAIRAWTLCLSPQIQSLFLQFPRLLLQWPLNSPKSSRVDIRLGRHWVQEATRW